MKKWRKKIKRKKTITRASSCSPQHGRYEIASIYLTGSKAAVKQQ
jgi:hypothetical protein